MEKELKKNSMAYKPFEMKSSIAKLTNSPVKDITDISSLDDKKVLKIIIFFVLEIIFFIIFSGFSVTSNVSEIIDISDFRKLIFSMFAILYFFFSSGNFVNPRFTN